MAITLIVPRSEWLSPADGEVTEPGHYWWLPPFLVDEPQNPANWSIKVWHPADPNRPRAGYLIGPLKPPI